MLAADPLFDGCIDLTVVLIVIVKTIVVFVILLVAVMFYVWFMRKVIADMQNRIGPQRAGPFGVAPDPRRRHQAVLQGAVDRRRSADRPVFRLAPYLAIIPAFLAFAIVPIGGLVIDRRPRDVPAARRPAASACCGCSMMSGIGLYGVMLAGWSSGSKYPLLGSVRASAQLLSYEAALGLAIVGVLVHTGHAVDARDRRPAGVGRARARSSREWYWLPAIGAFVIFLIAAIAETNHPPFDLVEAEQELVGGFHTEYTGIRFAIFFLAEFMNLITMCAIAVTLFLGGPSGPSLGFLVGRQLGQRLGDAGLLVHAEGARPALRDGLGAGHAAAAALRPADGPRLEVPHRARVPVGDGVGRAWSSAPTRAGTGGSPCRRRSRGAGDRSSRVLWACIPRRGERSRRFR